MKDFDREELSIRTDDSEHLDFFPAHYRVGRTKCVIVTGGVMSGVGKGVFTASLSELNPLRGDEPYLSVDIGSSTIKVVEIRGQTGQLSLANAATLPTPASAIQNNIRPSFIRSQP